MTALKIKKLFCILLALASITAILAGCGKNDSNEKRAEEIAVKVLSSTAEQRKKFSVEILKDTTREGIAGASGLIELYKKEYGEHLTDECIEAMLQNRAFPISDAEFFASSGDITAKEIKLTKSTASESSFDYTAKLFDGDNLFATASGSITFADASAQKAERITVKLTK